MKKLTELGKWKVGQEVILNKMGGSSIHHVYSITDENAGTIYLKHYAFSFDFNGRINSALWPNEYIEPANETDHYNKLREFDFSSLSLEQASALIFKMHEMGINI
jgi:hypothetical protein